ncbi:MAG TPA: FAD-dependent 5-carboxymethylaminomethyl-2-thiouridine(34) oxidoreductase MnmC [Burkholderiaceae bacterium]|nr:FAD-dependent 5-carboxymethylaminomethyl-2-thiouridine(34) oxidoreductase MnmC [Burkholderiaceae bacterium]
MSVLLAGAGLPQRWRGRERFVVLDTEFAAGHRFLAAWQAWRDDPLRCARLVFIALQPHVLGRIEPRAALSDAQPAGLADALLCAWPTQTPDLHRLSFDDGRVVLLLAPGDPARWLRELVAEIDAFCVAGAALANAERVCKAFGRLAAPGATLAAGADDITTLRAPLTSAGFEFRDGPEGGLMTARFAPAFAPRRVPACARDAVERHALIVGAGIAGCAAAWALAEQGWRSTLLERGPRIAGAASGNPAGLFHGIVNAQDGTHARFNRAAALAAHGAVQAAIERGAAGSARGLLRLEAKLDVAAMRALLQRLALPPEYVCALAAGEASEHAGITLAQPCWYYPGGGWVDPAGLARSFLDRAGAAAQLRTGADAHRLEPGAAGWRVLDARGQLLAEAQVVVLANAGDAPRLLDAPGWPIDSIRGQISIAPASALVSARLPVAGSGYLLPATDGKVMFGATAQRGDPDPAVREADHGLNLAQLERLLGHATGLRPAELEGRTGWRCSAADRLPVIGAVPDPSARGLHLDRPRLVPRQRGLYVFTALGSRGITWSALGAEVLASWVTGAPAPIGAGLLDAIDPARFVSREARRFRREPALGAGA